MKSTGIVLLIITTAILVLLTIFVNMNLPFAPLFFLMCLGQLLLMISVYKILTDNYSTTKTFDDFYEDHSPKDF
ncbi:hypothetical protein E0K83_16305 [Gramella sp. BOM4]|nr:hypothetical protein [Christiangramia bathymodioli]